MYPGLIFPSHIPWVRVYMHVKVRFTVSSSLDFSTNIICFQRHEQWRFTKGQVRRPSHIMVGWYVCIVLFQYNKHYASATFRLHNNIILPQWDPFPDRGSILHCYESYWSLTKELEEVTQPRTIIKWHWTFELNKGMWAYVDYYCIKNKK
jgi:hypothetical protein